MLLAARFPKLFAGVVILSPLARVNPAFVPGSLGGGDNAWTLRGRPLAPPGTFLPFRSVRADVFITAGFEDDLAFGYTGEREIVAGLAQLPHRRLVSTVYQHAGHFVDTAIPYLPVGGTYYNDALGVTESVGGTTAGDSAARADEWPRILRFIGLTRGV